MMRRFAFLLLVPTLALAQGQEPEWRVVNTNPPRVVPLYTGQANPFPIKQEPAPVVIEQPVAELDEATKALEAAREAAQQAVRSPKALVPVVRDLKPNGYLNGPRGPMALLNNRWYTVGQGANVPNRINPETLAIIDRLAELDEALRASLRQNLAEKLSSNPTSQAKIKSITPKQVIFSTPLGEIKEPISQPQW